MQIAKQSAEICSNKTITNISFRFDCKEIPEDSVIIVLEQIIYELLIACPEREIYVSFDKIKPNSLSHRYLASSMLFGFSKPFSRTIKSEFIDLYEKSKNIYGIDYVRWVCDSNTDYDALFEEVSLFIKHSVGYREIQNSESIIEELSEAIIEVAYNVQDHSNSEAVIQCKLLRDLVARQDHKPVYLFCCSIMNIGDFTIGGTLKNSIEKGLNDSRKEMVRTAFKNHELSFSTDYDEDDFYFLSSFQRGVTRKEIGGSNSYGTGLTVLLRSIKDKAVLSYCYCMSGKSVLHFLKEYLDVNEDGTIGFNAVGNYMEQPPSPEAVRRLPFFFPGSIYNLVLALEETKDGELSN